MVRTLAGSLVLVIALSGVPAFAQDSDEAWKNLVMQALYSAGANDLAKSEQLFQRALREAERFGPSDPRTGTTLNSLGLVYKGQKRYGEAEATFLKSLAVLEKAYGFDSIDVANVNFNVASVMAEEGKQVASMPHLEKCLATYRRQLGGQSLKSASVLCMIGDAYRAGRSWAQAEGPLKQCAEIREANGGMVNGELADALFSLAQVLEKEGKYALADPRYRLAEKIREKTQGIMSPGFADVLEAHAALLRAMGREADANKDAALAGAVRRNEQQKSK
jgi:tetratricopeptide (TPR) repeat protein